MRFLRLLLLGLLTVSVLLTVGRGSWEARLATGKVTDIIDLPTGPVWSPPAVPTYEVFAKRFTDLPPDMVSGVTIVRVFQYDTAMMEFVSFVAISVTFCGALYFLTRGDSRDVILHYALFIGLGFVAATFACFGLWILGGGWGPPFPLFFAFLGSGFGIFIGKARWSKNAT